MNATIYDDTTSVDMLPAVPVNIVHDGETLTVSVSHYVSPPARIAVYLTCADGAPYGVMSCNLPDAPDPNANVLTDDTQRGVRFYAKTWSENTELAKAALASGHFRDTGLRAPAGMVEAQVWEVVR